MKQRPINVTGNEVHRLVTQHNDAARKSLEQADDIVRTSDELSSYGIDLVNMHANLAQAHLHASRTLIDADAMVKGIFRASTGPR